MRRRAFMAAAGAALLVLTGCGSSDSDQAEGQDGPAGADCTYDTSFEGVAVSGATGSEAVIEITDEAPATELGVLDLCDGDGTAVAAGDTVQVDYVGVALSTGQTFDSSYQRGQPLAFGLDQVIPGWSEGLVGMQEGGTRLLVIPGELAYGPSSPTPEIGPNETLVFVVDLLAVQ